MNRMLLVAGACALSLLVPVVATSQTPPAANAGANTPNRAALERQRVELAARLARSSTPATLCALGEVEQQLGELSDARAHLEEGAQTAWGTSAERQAQSFRCNAALARVLDAQAHLPEAYSAAMDAWALAQRAPSAGARAAFETYALDLARRRWSGAQCAQGLERDTVVQADATVLQLLARGDSAPLRACLDALRTFGARAVGTTCRATRAPSPPATLFTPGAQYWTTVDPQTGVSAGPMIARGQGAAARYVECGAGEASAPERLVGRWLALGGAQVLVVLMDQSPCGEDIHTAEERQRCRPDRTAYVLDSELRLVGQYLLVSPRPASPLAIPFGTVRDAWPFRVENGDTLRVGAARLRLVQGALVPAP